MKTVRQKELDLKSGLQLDAMPLFTNREDGHIEFNGVQIQVINTGVSIDIRYETDPVDINLAQTSTPDKHYEVAESIDWIIAFNLPPLCSHSLPLISKLLTTHCSQFTTKIEMFSMLIE
ncbi:hypothetical protein [Citrobacter freundii]|uniref:hypothetical protein n=1 Tax=Citrobacter freundii TaxID=546 RepID=UPI003F9BA02E